MCCCFALNNVAESGFLGMKPNGILNIAKGIPFLANEDVHLDIAQLGLRRREIKLHSPRNQERTWMSIKSKCKRHWI
mgnify:CR=1 FL=1